MGATEILRSSEMFSIPGVAAVFLRIRWSLQFAEGTKRRHDVFQVVANSGRTKQSTLEFLERHPVGDEDARELRPSPPDSYDLVNKTNSWTLEDNGTLRN
jgi:hypothetical protein